MNKIEIFFDDIDYFKVDITKFSFSLYVRYRDNREIEFHYGNEQNYDLKQINEINQLISIGTTAPDITIQLMYFSNYNINLIKQFFNELNVNILKITGRTLSDLFSLLNYVHFCRVDTLEISSQDDNPDEKYFTRCINDICIKLLETDIVKIIIFRDWNFIAYPKHISCIIKSGDFIIQKIYDVE